MLSLTSDIELPVSGYLNLSLHFESFFGLISSNKLSLVLEFPSPLFLSK